MDKEDLSSEIRNTLERSRQSINQSLAELERLLHLVNDADKPVVGDSISSYYAAHITSR